MFRKSVCLAPRMLRTLLPPQKQLIRNAWGLSRPSSEFRAIVREMDRRMDEIERDFFNWNPFRNLARPVRIDGIQPISDNFSLELNVSGFKPEEIKLSFEKGKLRLQAEMDRKDKDGNVLKQLIHHEFSVPSNLDLSSVQSFLGNDGIIRITGHLKKELTDAKQIPITGISEEEANKTGK